MKRLFLWLVKPWVLSLLGVLLLSLLLWFEGPLLAFNGNEPFASSSVRWYFIFFFLAVWAGYFLWKFVVAHLANRRLMTALTKVDEPGLAPGAKESAQEVALLGQRMQEAISVLRKTGAGKKLGGNYLYQLPWYLFVGAPGSGKTTALVHSGLKFPLAEAMGPGSIGGVGGTRHCDWWFSDEAVLIDTAGRYTTQDSHTEVDQAAWHGFLDLLKKHRRRQPINGVIVALSVSDLLQQSVAGRQAQAKAIRVRIAELHKHLGIRFPVYVMVTKCDLLAGFVEFFDPLGREERSQVWGMTFPMEQANASSAGSTGSKDTAISWVDQALASFSDEFKALENQLQVRVLTRVQQERDLQRRALLYRFPQQFAGLGQVLGDFLNDAFKSTRYENTALLRGVYFTSGTQEGSPIDRVMASLAGAFGLDRKVLQANASSGRSYFLTTFLREVVFKEAELGGTNWNFERRRQRMQWLGYGVIGLVLALTTLGLVTSYFRNQQAILATVARVEQVDQLAHALPPKASLTAVLPLLNAARDIPGGYGYAQRDKSVALLDRFGLYQGGKLGAGSQAMYQRLLRDTLVPRIVSHLEAVLRRGDASNPEYLYEALRVYLMLGDRRYFDPVSVQAWLDIDWRRSLPEASDTQRQQLTDHTAALFSDSNNNNDTSAPPVLDASLIAKSRLTLAMMPLPQRIFNRLRRQLATAKLPEFSVNSAVGRDVSQVLSRQSGEPLSRGISGLYSVAGFRQFQLQVGQATADIAKDSWVLDHQEAVAANDADASLKAAVLQLYYFDYIRQWDAFLADVKVVPFTGLDQAARITNALSGPESPLRAFLKAAARETTLDGLRSTRTTTQVIDEAVKSQLDAARKKLQAAMGSGSDEPVIGGVKASNVVDQHFEALHKLVGGTDGASPVPLDQVLAVIKEASQYFDAADSARRGGTLPPAGDVLTRLKREADGKPAPVGALLQTIESAGGGLLLGSERARLNALWTASSAKFCQEAIAGRYPMVRAASKEVTSDDFGKFFAPNGLMDDFFAKNLASYVDMTGVQWHWRTSGAASLGISQEVLNQFQRSARLRDMLFSSSSRQPSLRFDLVTLSADVFFTKVRLDIDGQTIEYTPNTAMRPVSILLPSGKGSGQVHMEVMPALRVDFTTEGPWAWFRMMDKGLLEPSAQGERYKLTFDLEGRKVIYQLSASSVINPFRRDALEQFRCPASL